MPDFRDYIGLDLTGYLQHYGVGHEHGGHSGRYPWGSGKNPKQRVTGVAGVPIDRMSRTSTSDYWKEHYGKQMDDFYNSRSANSISELSRRQKSDDISEIREHINHPEDESIGRTYNCQNCSLAFEMVERGYDVSAKGKPSGSNVGDIEKYFKGGKMVNASSVDDLSDLAKLSKQFEETSDAYWDAISRNNVSKSELKRLDKANSDACDKFYDALNSYRQSAEDSLVKVCLSQGKDARGIVVVGWMDDENPDVRTNSFHAMNYKVENGKVKIYDAQSHRSEKQNGEWEISDMIDGFDPREIYVMRTDNLEPNESICDAVYSNRRKSK